MTGARHEQTLEASTPLQGEMVPWPAGHGCYLPYGAHLPDRVFASSCPLRDCHLDHFPCVPLHPPMNDRMKISAHA
jgi:hypothetical protein